MEKHQEPLTVRDLVLEQKMHRLFTPWSEAHRLAYPGIEVLPYNPEAYPEQRIDHHIVEAAVNSTIIPPRVFLWGMRHKIAAMFHNRKNGNEFVNAFNTTPAYHHETATVADVVAEEYIAQGKSVAIISDHADNLSDIAKAVGGMNYALNSRFGGKYLNDFGILVNKNMSREAHRGKPALRKISNIGEVHTVLPDTNSVEKYRKLASETGEEITDEDIEKISKKVTGGSARVILGRIKNGHNKMSHGLVEGIVPTGQGTIKLLDKHRKVKAYAIPSISETAAGLLCRFDAAVAVSLVNDRYRISPILPINQSPEYDGGSFGNLFTAENIMDRLAQQTAEIAGVPVHYQRLTPVQVGKTALNNSQPELTS